MFDYLRNLRKTAEEKRQEAISAYLDNALSADERRRFEAELAQDAALRAEVEQQRTVKMALRRLPQRRVPRNFTLDPAAVSRPAKQPLIQAYPVLRAATVLTAFLFIFALFAGLYTQSATGEPVIGVSMAPFIAQEETVLVEVTRVVTETVEIEGEPVVATEVVEVVIETVVETVEVEAETADSAAPEAAYDEVVEDTAAEEEMAEEAPAAPAEEEADGEMLVQPTNVPPATPSPMATTTEFTSPRVTATAEPNRIAPPPDADVEAGTTTDGVTGNAADDGEGAVANVAPTMIPTPETADNNTSNNLVDESPAANLLGWLIAGLLLILVLLVVLTWIVRRQLSQI